MTARISLVLIALTCFCAPVHGLEQRWESFAEDGDLRYFLDKKSVVPLPDNVYIFWLKSVAKDKDFFKTQYNLNDLSYIYTNYELDCAMASYRVRGTIMFDKYRREISKVLPGSGESGFEPIPPESLLELAQGEICAREEGAARAREPQGRPGSASASASAEAPSASASAPEAPEAPEAPVEPVPARGPEEPSAPASPAVPGSPSAPNPPSAPVVPATAPPSLM